MNNNTIIFPTPKQVYNEHIESVIRELDEMFDIDDIDAPQTPREKELESELSTLSSLTKIRSKKSLESLRGEVTKYVLREKGSELGNEIQRLFREYSMIYSTF